MQRVETQKREFVSSDHFLVFSIAVSLLYSPLCILVLATPLFRGTAERYAFPVRSILLLLIAGGYAVVAVLFRDGTVFQADFLRYLFLWLTPVSIYFYRPNSRTIRAFTLFILMLAIADVLFNICAFFNGKDLLGRVVDEREGIFGGARLGGLFGHSFYSGSISTVAICGIIGEKKLRALCVLFGINLIFAGSFRLLIPLTLIPWFYMLYRLRNREFEVIQIAVFSTLCVSLTFLFSSIGPFEPNPSNDFRIFAWTVSIDQIIKSPVFGVGFPNLNLESIGYREIEENLVTESWYLSSAITFGIPYLVIYVAGLANVFYGAMFKHLSIRSATLLPITFIDLVYGGAMEGMLYWIAIWLFFCADVPRSVREPQVL